MTVDLDDPRYAVYCERCGEFEIDVGPVVLIVRPAMDYGGGVVVPEDTKQVCRGCLGPEDVRVRPVLTVASAAERGP